MSKPKTVYKKTRCPKTGKTKIVNENAEKPKKATKRPQKAPEKPKKASADSK